MNWALDLNRDLEDQEPDAALLETAAWDDWQPASWTHWQPWAIAAYGCGIRYRYGMFKQKIENGYQEERFRTTG